MTETRILLGNEAIGRGIVEAGCHIVTSYPGTPSSEIIPAIVKFKKQLQLNTYIEWSANEKIAFDQALAASWAGKRSVVCMKQVGLNVAADSLMSSAYTGVVGGFVVVSCDDPGPHSSQTEQDSRFYAMFAKVPCYDPSTPQEAKEMVKAAFNLSEKYKIPVILRSTIRVSHAKQSVVFSPIQKIDRKADFQKDLHRWAATPRYRLDLHRELNKKLCEIQEYFEDNKWNYESVQKETKLGIITCSASFVALMDIMKQFALDIDVLKIGTPFPLPHAKVTNFINAHEKVLLIEETDTVIESQIIDKSKLLGRFTNHVPIEGELLPETICNIFQKTLKELGITDIKITSDKKLNLLIKELDLPIRKPTLCPGCPERAAFFAIRKTFPKAIYTSDIGCYTLGINLNAVDTVLDMGAGITMASGFYHAYNQDNNDIPIIATMGDSTFYHSGTSSLLSAVYNNASFILVVLDNEITAMTGMQSTPGIGITADGTEGRKVPLQELIVGCGVEWVKTIDPYDVEGIIKILKEAREYTQKEKQIAVIIARHPCLIRYPEAIIKNPVDITDDCTGCQYCIKFFECPALVLNAEETKVEIDRKLCSDCGICMQVCPTGAIVSQKK